MMLLTTTQAIFGLFLDAWLLGVVFNRLARGTPPMATASVTFRDRSAFSDDSLDSQRACQVGLDRQ